MCVKLSFRDLNLDNFSVTQPTNIYSYKMTITLRVLCLDLMGARDKKMNGVGKVIIHT